MTYVLHGARGSGSCAVECALAEIGVEYKLREHSLRDDEQLGERYAAINPHCKVPSLVIDGGLVLTESAALLLTLDERHPEAALLPAKGTPARAQALRWLLFTATEVYPIVEINDYPERFATDPDQIDCDARAREGDLAGKVARRGSERGRRPLLVDRRVLSHRHLPCGRQPMGPAGRVASSLLTERRTPDGSGLDPTCNRPCVGTTLRHYVKLAVPVRLH